MFWRITIYPGLAASKNVSAKLTKRYTAYGATLRTVWKQTSNWVCLSPQSCQLSVMAWLGSIRDLEALQKTIEYGLWHSRQRSNVQQTSVATKYHFAFSISEFKWHPFLKLSCIMKSNILILSYQILFKKESGIWRYSSCQNEERNKLQTSLSTEHAGLSTEQIVIDFKISKGLKKPSSHLLVEVCQWEVFTRQPMFLAVVLRLSRLQW